jgi:adenylate kinase
VLCPSDLDIYSSILKFLVSHHWQISTLLTMRKKPNIIITGTPGVGKTVHCEKLAESSGLVHLSINRIAKERQCHDGYDEELKSWIIEEEKVRLEAPRIKDRELMAVQLLDSIEDEVKEGGRIIDWHGCDLFPESWIDLVIVLRTNPTLLYDRLTERSVSYSTSSYRFAHNFIL